MIFRVFTRERLTTVTNRRFSNLAAVGFYLIGRASSDIIFLYVNTEG